MASVLKRLVASWGVLICFAGAIPSLAALPTAASAKSSDRAGESVPANAPDPVLSEKQAVDGWQLTQRLMRRGQDRRTARRVHRRQQRRDERRDFFQERRENRRENRQERRQAVPAPPSPLPDLENESESKSGNDGGAQDSSWWRGQDRPPNRWQETYDRVDYSNYSSGYGTSANYREGGDTHQPYAGWTEPAAPQVDPNRPSVMRISIQPVEVSKKTETAETADETESGPATETVALSQTTPLE